MTELTEEQITEGLQHAAAAARHWINGDHQAAFRTITYSESFPAAVHGLLGITGMAIAGSGMDPDRLLSQIVMEAQAARLNEQEETPDE